MRLSCLSHTPLASLPILILLFTILASIHTTATVISTNKRDLIGNLIPLGSPPPPAAATPAGPPAPTVPIPDGTKPNSTATGPLPGLISQVLNPPPILGSIGTTPSPTSTNGSGGPKKHPSAPAGGTDGDKDPNSSPNSKDNNADGSSTYSGGALSPGMITLLVIILLAMVGAVMFSCYRVRQSRRRRHQSWTEEILKDHVGYNQAEGGYGIRVAGHGSSSSNGGKGMPDHWL
ncbi:hypothetical protein BGX23_006612 [Mortierella sp. AD031]|nr:hypothetical protein BGX23_006612 [Mortierella sp. AD031]